MSNRRKLSRLALVPVLAAVIAAPAVAQPIDPPTASSHKPVSKLDLRTEGATGGTRAPDTQANPGADLRTENARDQTRAPKAPVGLPTWPLNPQPLTPVAQQPVAVDTGDGGDIDWPLAALALAGALLLGGSLGVAGTRYRTSHSHVAG